VRTINKADDARPHAGMFQPLQLPSARPMTSSRSRPVSHGNSSSNTRPCDGCQETLSRWRVYSPRLACKAANTFSAVIGKSIIRTPTASATALAIVAATGVLLLSPMPLLW